VVDAKAVQNGRAQVVAVYRLFDNFVAEIVRRAADDARLDAAPA